MTATRIHGGPDGADWAVQHDFSTNANACGPCPTAWAAVQAADARAYPDSHYTRLRERLAAFHGVQPHRIHLAASASEAIQRITAAFAHAHPGASVLLPRHCFGDLEAAAAAWQLPVLRTAVADAPAGPRMVWSCEPSSPLGQAQQGLAQRVADAAGCLHVLDLAYAPLRLAGVLALDAAERDAVWQLWSPNKALGLTGVRAAYLVAPQQAGEWAARLERLAPSWPVGAHGVALLEAWCSPLAQDWLAQSRHTLHIWLLRQRALLAALGWTCAPTEAHFFCAHPHLPPGQLPVALARLRTLGIALRDAASFGLPGQVRVAVLPPAAQDALASAWPRVANACRIAGAGAS